VEKRIIYQGLSDNYCYSFENSTSASKQGGWLGCVCCSMFYVFQLIISLYSLIQALPNKYYLYIGWRIAQFTLSDWQWLQIQRILMFKN